VSDRFIIDAHAHVGTRPDRWSPPARLSAWTSLMERLRIRCAICDDSLGRVEGFDRSADTLQRLHEESRGQLYYLAAWHPRHGDACAAAVRRARGRGGLVGLTVDPASHGIAADDDAYEPLWQLAAECALPVRVPPEGLADPQRLERFVAALAEVPLVIGHAGGRGPQRTGALRLAEQYPNVYLDIAGDALDYRLIETLVGTVGAEKVLFASDYPWSDPRANLCRVLLSDVDDTAKAKILCENAAAVFPLSK